MHFLCRQYWLCFSLLREGRHFPKNSAVCDSFLGQLVQDSNSCPIRFLTFHHFLIQGDNKAPPAKSSASFWICFVPFPVSDYITANLPSIYSLRRNDLITFDLPFTNKKKSEQNFFFLERKYANFIEEKTSMDITTNPIQFISEVNREFFDQFCKHPLCTSFFDCKV